MSEPRVHCTTCGDTSEPMRVVRAHADGELALCVAEDGVTREVDVAIVGPVATGEWLLVHAGAALSRERR